jgi:hypothetical protein
MVACRLPPGTNVLRPAAIPRHQPPHPHSTAPPQSTPRTDAAPHAGLPLVVPVITAWPVTPDPTAVDPRSQHPPPGDATTS